jgi:hypothetical protein
MNGSSPLPVGGVSSWSVGGGKPSSKRPTALDWTTTPPSRVPRRCSRSRPHHTCSPRKETHRRLVIQLLQWLLRLNGAKAYRLHANGRRLPSRMGASPQCFRRRSIVDVRRCVELLGAEILGRPGSWGISCASLVGTPIARPAAPSDSA